MGFLKKLEVENDRQLRQQLNVYITLIEKENEKDEN